MAQPLKILFLSSEVAPFTKTGGLADVAGSLPKAVAALGHDVRVVQPAYGAIEARALEGGSGIGTSDVTLRVPVDGKLIDAGVFESTLPGSQVPISFIAERNTFARPAVYGYHDDPFRFAFFCRAALDLEVAARGWRPDVVHAHDWHAAPAVFWLATAANDDWRYRSIPTVFTIHNLMHQGHAAWDLTRYLGISLPTGLPLEPYGGVNLMARGIFHGTMVTTVSPTYAREVMTREGGSGLDGLLRDRHFDLHGVLNGLDYDVWNPRTDELLEARFDVSSLGDRAGNKRALQARLGLPQRDDVPLVAMVTRLDWQKGLDLMGHVAHLLMNGYAGEAQFVVLGSGAKHYEDMLAQLAGVPPRQDGRRAGLQRRAGAAHLRRQRHVPDAVAVRAVRPGADDCDALRVRSRGAGDRRAGGHRARRRDRVHLLRVHRRRLLERAAARGARVVLRPRQLGVAAAAGHGHGLVVGDLGAGLPADLRLGDLPDAGVVRAGLACIAYRRSAIGSVA